MNPFPGLDNHEHYAGCSVAAVRVRRTTRIEPGLAGLGSLAETIGPLRETQSPGISPAFDRQTRRPRSPFSSRNLTGLAEPMKSFLCEDPDNAFVQVLHRGFGIYPFPLPSARTIAVNRASTLFGFSRPSSIRVAVDWLLPGDDLAWKRSRHLATEAD